MVGVGNVAGMRLEHRRLRLAVMLGGHTEGSRIGPKEISGCDADPAEASATSALELSQAAM